MFSFVKLYQLTKKEGINQKRIVNAVKIAEKLPFLEAECQLINDNIDELNTQKESIREQFNFMLEEVKSAREYRENELKHEQEKLDEQKVAFAEEVNKFKEYAINEIKSMQERIDKQKQEEQQLTGRIQVLNNEVLKILSYLEEARRKKQQEQDIQEPQLVYQQLGQQERPNLLEQKQTDPVVQAARAIFLNQFKLASRCLRPKQLPTDFLVNLSTILLVIPLVTLEIKKSVSELAERYSQGFEHLSCLNFQDLTMSKLFFDLLLHL